MKKIAIFLIISILTISCTTKVDKLILKGKILKAEDSRNSQQLTMIANSINETMVDEGKLIAIASGRIPSFESFKIIASKFKNNIEVTDKLAIAARFPETNFDKHELFEILSNLVITENVVETMLYLNTEEGLNFALHQDKYAKTIAFNLWRAKDFVNEELLKKYYEIEPETTVYSLARLKIKNIAKTEDILKMGLEGRAYGSLVCNNPEPFLEDKDWQVRVFALRATNNKKSAEKLLNDENKLVKETAYEIFLKNKGKLKYEKEKLTVREAEIILQNTKDKKLAEYLFKKEGMFKEIGASYLPKNKKDQVIESDLKTSTKIHFIETNYSKEEALKFAMDEFMFNKDKFGLIYVLESKNNLLRKQAAEKAINLGKDYISLLTDYKDVRESYNLEKKEDKPLSYYLNVLNINKLYKGFEIETELGKIKCKFLFNYAPLTCNNIINLANKDYFKSIFFHRIVPAFVTQDGDPTGTGSGGPGYSIRCEYNELKYNKKGMVGMALAGKDTGGSQYFLTHLATPHLNHQYTIFAEIESGFDVLDKLQKYDKILNLKAIKKENKIHE